METKHTHNYRKGRGSVDVCDCGRFRHNEKAGPAIVGVDMQEQTNAQTLVHKVAELNRECIKLRSINADLLAALKNAEAELSMVCEMIFVQHLNPDLSRAKTRYEMAKETIAQLRAAIAKAEGKE